MLVVFAIAVTILIILFNYWQKNCSYNTIYISVLIGVVLFFYLTFKYFTTRNLGKFNHNTNETVVVDSNNVIDKKNNGKTDTIAFKQNSKSD